MKEHTNYFTLTQGTVLGPILFIVYIIGLLRINLDVEIYCYADDTVLLVNHQSYNDLLKIANKCLR